MIPTAWTDGWNLALNATRALGGQVHPLVVSPPAAPADADRIERDLGRPLPASLRRLALDHAAAIELHWFLPEDTSLPSPLREVRFGGVEWSLARLPDLEAARADWVASCFPNPDDPYDAIWHRVLAVLPVANGDLIAIDPRPDGNGDGPVVYVSHEDGELHGRTLAPDALTFFDRWSRLGCPGPEEWLLEPFSNDAGQIDPLGTSARLWLEFLRDPPPPPKRRGPILLPPVPGA